MKKKNTIYLIIILLVLTLGLVFLVNTKPTITTDIRDYDNSYTKAICNETNYCQDYVVECRENEVVKITPTGKAVQHEENWQDPRPLDSRNRLCS